MSIKNCKSIFPIILVFILIFSALVTNPVYADETAPTAQPTTEQQVEDTDSQLPPEQEATPQPTSEVDSAPSTESTPEPVAPTESPILEQLPENTQIIVVDESGEALPLATEEAQQIIMEGDPMWCPVGVTPGGAGCTASTTSFATMLVNLTTMYGAAGPSMAGVIWISQNYNSNTHDFGVTTFNIDGSALTAMKDYALTIQGGWTESGKGINPNSPSEFVGAMLFINNWNAPVTINDIKISNSTSYGLRVVTTGNVVIKNVTAENNGNNGARIENDGGTGNVTITKSTFNDQTNTGGLYIVTKGTVTIKDLTANDNNGSGAYIQNQNADTPRPVTLSGTNIFNDNNNSGLFISSIGVITLNNIIANDNGYDGAAISNNHLNATNAGVKLTGTNVFGNNTNNGLTIDSKGAITLNNIYANSNNSYGVSINNSAASTAQGVTFTGTNEFKYNVIHGLSIISKGAIVLNNLSANGNGQMGVNINNSGTAMAPTTIKGTNTFNLNGYSGLFILYSASGGAVTLSNITANDNGQSGFTGYGVSINNSTGTTFKGVTITGANSFNNNFYSGLAIITSGAVTLNNITASNNYGISAYGVNISNTASGNTKPMAVTLNGSNTFNFNDRDGLTISSYGAVTLNNIKANDNGQSGIGGGVYISNSNASKPQNVTIKGINEFNDNADNGLYVYTDGNILTNSLTANLNSNRGVELINSVSGSGSVTMTGNNFFSGNTEENLYISSLGVITLNNLTSNSSANSHGAYINNGSTSTAKNVTINGTNTFNSNDGYGLNVISKGVITVNNLNATSNGFGGGNSGVYLYNILSPTNAGVNVNGTNTFNSNDGNGLLIWTLGNVKTNAISANSNSQIGFEVFGSFSPNNGSVTMNGNNSFTANTGGGVQIQAYGIVTLNNITATGSTGGNGVYIINTYAGNNSPKKVTLNGANTISNNGAAGLQISTFGAVLINNLTASNNATIGASIQNNGATVPAAGVTLNGTNKFNSNGSDNLNISSDGLIKVNNITSTNSGNMGASLSNITGNSNVIVSGTNYFDSNSNAGLYIESAGAITLSNITSINSINDFGAQISNTASTFAKPKNVILSGTNNFSGNADTGLEIRTFGSVTINNITASNNGSDMNLAYGEGVDIINYFGTNTIVANVTLTGNNTFNNNYTQGLYISSFGAIKLNNITANNNGTTANTHGVTLSNQSALSNAYGVTITGNNTFYNNGYDGLNISTKGAVVLNNLNITDNGGTYGLYVDNTFAGASTPKSVTMNGTNNLSNNNVHGFYIKSYGAVTVSKITASGNTSGAGGLIDNSGTNVPSNITITGYGVFNNNTNGNGLMLTSKGAITLTNITTIGNLFSGLDVDNSAGTGNVTITGTNIFTNNGDNGATINSNGNVSITKATGDDNSQSGLVIVTTKTVTLTCASFNMNTWYGWEVTNASLVTLKGVFTAANGFGDFNTASPLSIFRACPLP